MNLDELQLPGLTQSQYQNLPQFLLQTPNLRYNERSFSPQQMNIDTSNQTLNDNPAGHRNTNTNININKNNRHSNTNSNSNDNNMSSTQIGTNTNDYYINSNNNNSTITNNNTNNRRMSSADLNIIAPGLQDFESLFSMIYTLNERLDNNHKIPIVMLGNYRMMVAEFGKAGMHPNYMRLTPLLLAIYDLFKAQEINPSTTHKLLHQIYNKYQLLQNHHF